jgi:hypothetical protein
MTVRPKRFLMSNFFIKLLLLGPLLIPFMRYLVKVILYWVQKEQFDEKIRYQKMKIHYFVEEKGYFGQYQLESELSK